MARSCCGPSVIYAPAIRALLDAVEVHAVAHITGGGLPGNLNRVLGEHQRRPGRPGLAGSGRGSSPSCSASATSTSTEMRKVFNLGIGMVAVVPPESVHKALDVLRRRAPGGGHR